jgi:hypothetical protein
MDRQHQLQNKLASHQHHKEELVLDKDRVVDLGQVRGQVQVKVLVLGAELVLEKDREEELDKVRVKGLEKVVSDLLDMNLIQAKELYTVEENLNLSTPKIIPSRFFQKRFTKNDSQTQKQVVGDGLQGKESSGNSPIQGESNQTIGGN